MAGEAQKRKAVDVVSRSQGCIGPKAGAAGCFKQELDRAVVLDRFRQNRDHILGRMFVRDMTAD